MNVLGPWRGAVIGVEKPFAPPSSVSVPLYVAYTAWIICLAVLVVALIPTAPV